MEKHYIKADIFYLVLRWIHVVYVKRKLMSIVFKKQKTKTKNKKTKQKKKLLMWIFDIEINFILLWRWMWHHNMSLHTYFSMNCKQCICHNFARQEICSYVTFILKVGSSLAWFPKIAKSSIKWSWREVSEYGVRAIVAHLSPLCIGPIWDCCKISDPDPDPDQELATIQAQPCASGKLKRRWTQVMNQPGLTWHITRTNWLKHAMSLLFAFQLKNDIDWNDMNKSRKWLEILVVKDLQ